MGSLHLSGQQKNKYMNEIYDSLKKELQNLKCRVEKLESMAYFSGNIDNRLDAIIKTEGVVYEFYDIDVSYFSNTNPVKMRKRGHHFSTAQKAFLALLTLLREQGIAYNFLDAYYKTGSYKKILEFTEYISVNEKERVRYNSAKEKLKE